jgi:hypothetical protein
MSEMRVATVQNRTRASARRSRDWRMRRNLLDERDACCAQAEPMNGKHQNN